MNLKARISLLTAVLGVFAGTIVFLSTGGGTNHGTGQPGGKRWESSTQCRECHQDVYDEWHGSHHQIAFTNPEVRLPEMSDNFRKEECMDCHLPRPLAVTGFGKRTLPRRTHFDEGVSCISCHLGPDGGLLARNDRPDVPCQPKASPEFFAVDACASCHNQHWTTDQWRASHYAVQGIDCAACHMPAVDRVRPDGSKRVGRRHVFTGAHDRAMLQKAAEFTAGKDGQDLVLTLTNVGAGHNFPTEERHRAVDMVYRFVTADGPGPWLRAWRCRQPYRDESEPINPGNASGENTQLAAGATKTVRVPIPAGTKAIDARLWYRLTPLCDDADPRSTLLFERRVELP